MTDSNLMDAECIHGVVWYDCKECIIENHLNSEEEHEDESLQ